MCDVGVAWVIAFVIITAVLLCMVVVFKLLDRHFEGGAK